MRLSEKHWQMLTVRRLFPIFELRSRATPQAALKLTSMLLFDRSAAFPTLPLAGSAKLQPKLSKQHHPLILLQI
jgi:hypothetical protein